MVFGDAAKVKGVEVRQMISREKIFLFAIATSAWALAGCVTVSHRPIQTLPSGSEEIAVVPYPQPVAVAPPAVTTPPPEAVLEPKLQAAVLLPPAPAMPDYTGEKIFYKISPFGFSEYEDHGLVQDNGKTLRLVTLKTRAMGVDDLEKIYIDPATLLPVRAERQVELHFSKEYLVEDYSAETASLDIKKYIGKKLVKEYHFKADGPIQNVVFLPFSLRAIPELKLGQTFYAYFPKKFKIRLVSVDEIKIPAGRFKAWHFISEPHKFEVWISHDAERVPLEIRVAGGSGYVMVMESRQMPAVRK
jgi:hypothetical protein